MDYAEAKNIRGQSFGSRMADKLAQGQGIGSSLKATLSEGSKARMTGLKEKFDPMNIAKFMTGGSKLGAAVVGKLTGRSQKDMEYFTGKKSSTKIDKLESGNEMVDMLMKIYSLMQKTNEDNTKRHEEEDNFKEEKEMEKLRRHKELIEAITGQKYAGKASVIKKEKKDGSSGGGILDDILGAFGGASAGLSLLRMVGGFFLGPVGIAILGVTALAGLAYLLWKNSDPEMVKSALAGEGPAGVGAAGLGSEGQLPSYDEEKAQATLEAKAKAVDSKGMTKASVDELEAKRDLLVSHGKAKSPEVAELIKEIESRKSSQQTGATATALPASPTGSSPAAESSQKAEATTSESATPKAMAENVPSPNPGQQLNQVQTENLLASVQEKLGSAVNTITNSAISRSVSAQAGGSKMGAVRNQEPTFQKMIYESTRVV
jgi:hypothetical protein